ncbi:hypothetical protein IF1G_03725 [Cordyceps javanica]|uniref:Uncharacterized protein n=1 Tax=Cordyceps javanica TaxID=43265 RepID=A0A545V8D6_9HYPO|nr:hypothetical protein IF1G_03725 [Cordyceps javanica]
MAGLRLVGTWGIPQGKAQQQQRQGRPEKNVVVVVVVRYGKRIGRNGRLQGNHAADGWRRKWWHIKLQTKKDRSRCGASCCGRQPASETNACPITAS